MTGVLTIALLSSALLLAAFGGPWVLRQAAPALAAVPRFAAITVAVTALIWVAALLALGPVIAWISRGPALLPDHAAEVCARCLAAATPLSVSLVQTAIPAALPLMLPLIGGAVVTAGLWRELKMLRQTRGRLQKHLTATGSDVTMLGYRIRVVADDGCFAFSLPRRFGGIVISRGAAASLSSAELAAVLQHEEAHISQRHHLLLALLNGATYFFRRVPIIQAVRHAVPHYFEIAADQAARHETDSTALAGALLKLGKPTSITRDLMSERSAVLHAAGSERIRLLVGEPRPPASVALAIAAGFYIVMLLTAIASVHTPYLLALATGC